MSVTAGLHHDKFVAAEPGHHVLNPRQRAQPLGDGAEQKVAAVMAEGVVDLLEAVEVDEVQRDLAADVRRQRERAVQPLDQARAVGEAGQRVVMGEETDAAIGLLLLPRALIPCDGRNAECERGQQAER